jgi:hypothetical protein
LESGAPAWTNGSHDNDTLPFGTVWHNDFLQFGIDRLGSILLKSIQLQKLIRRITSSPHRSRYMIRGPVSLNLDIIGHRTFHDR